MHIVRITDTEGHVIAPDWLARAEPVHRQLRPQIPAPFADSMERVFAGGGRMLVAVEEETVRGVGVFRVYENTAAGLKLYVDDLVVDEEARSQGMGRAMLDWLEAEARRPGCSVVDLESGTPREGAHRFYFRAGYTIRTFGFKKTP
jgi:GNAT superfamily N-acetyltransferase